MNTPYAHTAQSDHRKARSTPAVIIVHYMLTHLDTQDEKPCSYRADKPEQCAREVLDKGFVVRDHSFANLLLHSAIAVGVQKVRAPASRRFGLAKPHHNAQTPRL